MAKFFKIGADEKIFGNSTLRPLGVHRVDDPHRHFSSNFPGFYGETSEMPSDFSYYGPLNLTSGSVWAYGYFGNLINAGIFKSTTTYSTSPALQLTQPQKVNISNPISVIALGFGHTMFIDTSGAMYHTGSNANYQSGMNTATNNKYPTAVQTGNTWGNVVSGAYAVLAITTAGTPYVWGSNSNYATGLNTTTGNQQTPVTPTQLSGVTFKTGIGTASSSSNNFLAIDSTGLLWGWGLNSSGQLGNGTTTNVQVPTQIGVKTWAWVSCGNTYSLAIDTDGKAWSCGSNTSYKTGLGTSSGNTTTWTQIGAATNWTMVSASPSTATLLLNSLNELYFVGLAGNGEDGVPRSNGSAQNTLLKIADGVKKCYAGYNSTHYINTDDVLWSCGKWLFVPFGNNTVYLPFTRISMLKHSNLFTTAIQSNIMGVIQ